MPSSPSQNTSGSKIQLRDIELYRGTQKTLQIEEMNIPAESFTAIVGLSGSGKTTLLETLAGILRPQKGQVKTQGVPLEERFQKHQRELAYVPQEHVIHDEITVRKAVENAAVLRLKNGEINQQSLQKLLEQLHIDDIQDRKIEHLSGGQKKRVSLATEMVSSPQLLLLDEPGAGLDTANYQELLKLLEYFSNQGCTVIITTHNTQYLDLFDQLILVDRGTTVTQGKPDRILSDHNADSYNDLLVKLLSSSSTSEKQYDSWWDSIVFPLYPLYLIIQGLLFWSFILVRDFIKLLYRSAKAVLARPGTSLYFFFKHLLPRVFCLLNREQTVLFRHRGFLTYLAFLPFVIGILIGVVGNVNEYPSQILYLTLVAGFWLGLNSSALSIIREMSIMKHERLMSPFKESYVIAYLLAKLLWYGLIGVIVGFILIGGIYLVGSFHFPPFLRSTRTWLSFGIIEFTVLTGVIIGLLISAVSENQVFAMALIPLIVLPGLLLSRPVLNKTVYEPVGTPQISESTQTAQKQQNNTGNTESDAGREGLLSPVWYWMYRTHPLSFLYESMPLTLRPSPKSVTEDLNRYLHNTLLWTMLPVFIANFFLFFLTHLMLLFRGQIGLD